MIISTFVLHILELGKTFGIESFAKMLELPALRGISGVEGDTKIYKRMNLKEIKRIYEGNGIISPCIYHEARCDGVVGNDREALIDEIKLQLENCAFMESPIFMAVPNCVETPSPGDRRAKKLEYFRICAELSRPYGIRTVAENYSSPNSTFATIADTALYLEELGDVDFVLDTGNYFFTHSDPLEACEKFFTRIAHVHAKDIKEVTVNPPSVLLGRGYEIVAMGDGDIPVFDIVKKLKQNGYAGALSIEISSSPKLPEKMRRSIDNLSEWIR